MDPVDFPEEGPAAAGSEEPGLPEALTRKENEAAVGGTEEPGLPEALSSKEKEAATSEPNPCKEPCPFLRFFFLQI